MSYGIEVFNGSGVLVFGMDAEGGLFLGTFGVVASGSPTSFTYPEAAGRTVVVCPMGQDPNYGGNSSPAAPNISLPLCVVDYALGYPRVTATPGGRAATVYVFAQ